MNVELLGHRVTTWLNLPFTHCRENPKDDKPGSHYTLKNSCIGTPIYKYHYWTEKKRVLEQDYLVS